MFLGSRCPFGPRPKSSLTSPSYARLPRPPCHLGHLAPGRLAWLTCRSFRLAAVMHCWLLHRPASDSSSDTSPSLCSLGHHDNCDPLPRHPLHLVRSHLLGLGLHLVHPRSTVTAQSPDRNPATGKYWYRDAAGHHDHRGHTRATRATCQRDGDDSPRPPLPVSLPVSSDTAYRQYVLAVLAERILHGLLRPP